MHCASEVLIHFGGVSEKFYQDFFDAINLDEEFNLTPRQLINKLSKLDNWDYEDFFENNPTDNFNHFNCKKKLMKQILEDYETAKNVYHAIN